MMRAHRPLALHVGGREGPRPCLRDLAPGIGVGLENSSLLVARVLFELDLFLENLQVGFSEPILVEETLHFVVNVGAQPSGLGVLQVFVLVFGDEHTLELLSLLDFLEAGSLGIRHA